MRKSRTIPIDGKFWLPFPCHLRSIREGIRHSSMHQCHCVHSITSSSTSSEIVAARTNVSTLEGIWFDSLHRLSETCHHWLREPVRRSELLCGVKEWGAYSAVHYLVLAKSSPDFASLAQCGWSMRQASSWCQELLVGGNDVLILGWWGFRVVDQAIRMKLYYVCVEI